MTSGPYQLLPDLSDIELLALRESIEAHGVLVPIVIDENGDTLDGHHRKLIADTLGIECPQEVRHGLTDPEKRTLAYGLNVNRRQMDTAAKRALVADSLRRDPELSDRQHASRTGADHKTVGTARGSLERRGEIPHVEVKTDTKGRKVGAKPPAKQPEDRGEGAPAPASGDTLAAPDPASENAEANAAGDAGGQPEANDMASGAAGPVPPSGPAAKDETDALAVALEARKRLNSAMKAMDAAGAVPLMDAEGRISFAMTLAAVQDWVNGWCDELENAPGLTLVQGAAS